MPFFHMCCAYIIKKHLALLVAGCFFFLFAFTCLSIPDGRIGLFSNFASWCALFPERIGLLPSNIGLFSNRRDAPDVVLHGNGVYCPLISGCSLTKVSRKSQKTEMSLLPSNIGLFSNPVSVSAHKQRAPGPFCGANYFYLFYHCFCLS